MGRKLWAVIAGGAVAGALSALVAFAAFSDHPVTADAGLQPSSLLESATGNGGGTVATAPNQPGQSGQAPQGVAGAVAGRSQPGAGAGVVIRGLVPPAPQPQAGGQGAADVPQVIGDAPAGTSGSPSGASLTPSPAAAGSGTTSSTTSTVTAAGATSASSASASVTSAVATSTSTSTSRTTTRHQLICVLGICL